MVYLLFFTFHLLLTVYFQHNFIYLAMYVNDHLNGLPTCFCFYNKLRKYEIPSNI